MMTDAELALVDSLGACYVEFARLSREHELAYRRHVDSDTNEFASRIHDLQARVMWLGARRAHPDRLS